MTTYPYEPPRREYADTLLAFRDFQMSSEWAALVEPDPLGPVNKIVTLMRGGRRVKSVLWPVPPGASVQVVRNEGAWTMDEVFALRQQIWDARDRGEEPKAPPHRPPGWRIEVNGETALTVTDAAMMPPRPPSPKVPLWTRMRRVLREQVRADADWIAGRLGYHREDECGGWDE